jgi:hypothetical protein
MSHLLQGDELMKKRANLMFLKNKALTVFRFGHKEDPKEGLKGTDGISPEDLSKLNKKDTK